MATVLESYANGKGGSARRIPGEPRGEGGAWGTRPGRGRSVCLSRCTQGNLIAICLEIEKFAQALCLQAVQHCWGVPLKRILEGGCRHAQAERAPGRYGRGCEPTRNPRTMSRISSSKPGRHRVTTRLNKLCRRRQVAHQCATSFGSPPCSIK